MIVEVHDAEAAQPLSGPERFVRRVLREGGADLPAVGGLALFEVTIPRRRRFRGSAVDLLVWTPHRCIVVQIHGLASVQHGELDIRSNGRWQVGERPADLELPKSTANPLVQARRCTLDVQALFQRHDLVHHLETLVVLVPKTSSRITGQPPDFGDDTCVVFASPRQTESLNRYFHRRVDGTPNWTVDDIVGAWSVLGRAEDLPERAELAAQGFTETESAPAAEPTDTGTEQDTDGDTESGVIPDVGAAAGAVAPAGATAGAGVDTATGTSTEADTWTVADADPAARIGVVEAADVAETVEAHPDLVTAPNSGPVTEVANESEQDAASPLRYRRRSAASVRSTADSARERLRRLVRACRPGTDRPPEDPHETAVRGSDHRPAAGHRGQAPKSGRLPTYAASASGAVAPRAGTRPAPSRNDSAPHRPKRAPVAGASVIVVMFLVLVFGACAVGTRFDVGDYAAMCASPRAFAEAAAYTENGPSPIAAVGELAGLTGYQGSALWHPDEASSVQLVACMSQTRTGELVDTCRYEPGPEQPVGRTLNLFRAVYRVTVYEATTGNRVTTTEIEGQRFSDDGATPAAAESDPCRAAAAVADEEDVPGRRYSRVSRSQINEVLAPLVQRGNQPEQQD